MLAALARREDGLVTRSALLEAGFGRRAIGHRLTAGRLFVVFRGVYSVLQPPLLPGLRRRAAVLACGPGAYLSHLSAAIQWHLLAELDGVIHVVRVGAHRRGPAGIHVHETRCLAPADVRTRSGVPVTSPLRTLLDLAATGHPGLGLAVDEAQALRLVTRAELEVTEGRPGSAALRRLLTDVPGFTRSEAERRLRSLILKAQLPRPRYNVRVLGHEADAYWPEQRLILEVDGYAAHGHRTAFEQDRERDQERIAAGLRTLRVTWRQLTATPEALAARLGAALA